MCTSKATKYNCIHSLPWECGVSDAIEPRNLCGIEWHAQHAIWLPRRDWTVSSINPVKEAPMGPRSTHLFEHDTLFQAREHRFQPLEDFDADLFFLLLILFSGEITPIINPVRGKCMEDLRAFRTQRRVQ